MLCRIGLEPTPLNFARVSHAMAGANVEHHHPNEYPKALNARNEYGRLVPVLYPHGHPKYGLPVVFDSQEDEAAYLAEAARGL
jgi:hypothetical protein